MMLSMLLAVTLLSLERNGISLRLDADCDKIDPAKSIKAVLTIAHSQEVKVVMPDLRLRVRGFSLAEDYEDPVKNDGGRVIETAYWKLVPEPLAERYQIAPFLVEASPRLLSARADEGCLSLVAGPVDFLPPDDRPGVTGEMECDPHKDLPPLSWKLCGQIVFSLILVTLLGYAVYSAVKIVTRKLREHRMSPIERAWVELERLLNKGLPGRGRYKDFYVELTMVVRRYVQRRYGIKAPQLTTNEFLKEFGDKGYGMRGDLKRFLESADMVKFAGLEATVEMADDATESARQYLRADSTVEGGGK